MAGLISVPAHIDHTRTGTAGVVLVPYGLDLDGNWQSLFPEEIQGLVQIYRLIMIAQVFDVRRDDRWSLLDYVFHHQPLVIGLGLALKNGYRPLGAFPYTGAQTVTEKIAYQARLALNDLQSSFRASRHAQTTPVTFFFVNTDYLTFHEYLRSIWMR
jgi:hypothetical protein